MPGSGKLPWPSGQKVNPASGSLGGPPPPWGCFFFFLGTFLRATKAQGANIPTTQAHPITIQQVLQVPAPVGIWVLLAWVTLSRWGDVEHLRAENFVVFSPVRIVIDWGTLPKGRATDPFCPSRYADIQGRWTAPLFSGLRGKPPTRDQLIPLLRQVDPRLTAHSIKRGAVTEATRHAHEAGVPPVLVSRLAKHSEKGLPGGMVNTTLRYNAVPGDLALVLETARVTSLM